MTVKEYLLQDRQWPHHLRVAHATMQYKKSLTDAERSFWRQVLEANRKQ